MSKKKGVADAQPQNPPTRANRDERLEIRGHGREPNIPLPSMDSSRNESRYVPPPPNYPPPPHHESQPPPPAYPPPRHASHPMPTPSFTERYHPSLPPPNGYGNDNYRPPQGEFTFRSERPSGIKDHHDSYRPGPARPAQGRAGLPPKPPKPQRNGQGGGRGHRGKVRPSWTRFMAAERELVSGYRSTQPEKALFDATAASTFRNPADVSDDEELDMDISDDDGGTCSKRARTALVQANETTVPKWSNPDVYAVAGEDVSQQKKKDVVAFIRKARVQSTDSRAPALTETEEDFIPCSPDSDEDRRLVVGRGKRTHDDRIKLHDHAKLGRGIKTPVDGQIKPDWAIGEGQDRAPWKREDNSDSSIGVRLHKEACDFYDFVRPREFEQRVRDRVVRDLKAFTRKHFRTSEVYPFGSFPSGLYLPTGDMDFVLASDQYYGGGTNRRGRALFERPSANMVRKFAAELDRARICRTYELILYAKVPLVKYVDEVSGLKVDVSFEKLGGVDALNTFSEWKKQFPAMPMLVTMVKHLLLMRGLNEPVNGGIGGFSVVCLVVSMLQNHAGVRDGMDTRHHLGQLFMDFLELYGKQFRYQDLAICLTQPYYRKKRTLTLVPSSSKPRLCIIDPNNPANDIAGGSSNTPVIINTFSQAFDALQQRLLDIDQGGQDRKNDSILEVVFAGNYTSFAEQRERLRRIDESMAKGDPNEQASDQALS